MSYYITFKPTADTPYTNGWPDSLTGNDFGARIDLSLTYDGRNDDFAEYKDDYGNRYAFDGKENGLWNAQVREE